MESVSPPDAHRLSSMDHEPDSNSDQSSHASTSCQSSSSLSIRLSVTRCCRCQSNPTTINHINPKSKFSSSPSCSIVCTQSSPSSYGIKCRNNSLTLPKLLISVITAILVLSICGGQVHGQVPGQHILPCFGEWRYPEGCEGSACSYRATWRYVDQTDEIVFTIGTKYRNKWTGIGFSANRRMPGTDAVLGLVEESGRFFMMDIWLSGYEAPPLDLRQDIANMTAWRENDLTVLQFSRSRRTGDSKDFQFSDTSCPYLIFPVQGGVFNAVNKRIRKHDMTPIVSKERICIKSCLPPSTTTTSTTSSTTTTSTTTSTTPRPRPTITSHRSQPTTRRHRVETTALTTTTTTTTTTSTTTTPSTTTSTTTTRSPAIDKSSSKSTTLSVLKPINKETFNPNAQNRDNQVPYFVAKLKLSPDYRHQLNAFNENSRDPDYDDLENQDSDAEEALLEKVIESDLKQVIPGLESVRVIEIYRPSELDVEDDDQSNYVRINLTVNENYKKPEEEMVGDEEDDSDYESDSTPATTSSSVKLTPPMINELLSGAIKDGKLGNVSFDSNYLVLEPISHNENRGKLLNVKPSEADSEKKSFLAGLTDDQLKWVVIIGGCVALCTLVLLQAVCMIYSNKRAERVQQHQHHASEKKGPNASHWKDFSGTTASSAYRYENFAVSDDPDAAHRGYEKYHHSKSNNNASKISDGKLHSEMTNEKNGGARGFGYPSTYDRREGRSGGASLSGLQPDFYFMPHQRRYSGEYVRVFVDNNLHSGATGHY